MADIVALLVIVVVVICAAAAAIVAYPYFHNIPNANPSRR